MKISIISAGNVGTALGFGLSKAGHQITFGVRSTNSLKAEKASEAIKDAIFQSVEDACREADVIIVTTPPEAVLSLIPQLGDVKNKVVIDATNSIRTKPDPYPTAFHAIKDKTKSERIIKCFNSTGYENMADPTYPNFGAIDMFCAGSDKHSKSIVQQLAKEIGFAECWDFGGDDKVELLEKFALSWINLAIMQGHGRNIAFKVAKR